jgi:hypothetical protein
MSCVLICIYLLDASDSSYRYYDNVVSSPSKDGCDNTYGHFTCAMRQTGGARRSFAGVNGGRKTRQVARTA